MKYMALIKDPERATSLFAADAAIEIPYLVDVGLPGKFEGHDGILAFLRQINTLFPDVAFTNLRVFVDTPDQVVSEYEVHCSAPATKRHYHQLFFGRLMASGGQITLLREAMNIISTAQTILPNGLSRCGSSDERAAVIAVAEPQISNRLARLHHAQYSNGGVVAIAHRSDGLIQHDAVVGVF